MADGSLHAGLVARNCGLPMWQCTESSDYRHGCCKTQDACAGTAPPASHQHQNGTPAPRLEPAKEKRSPVSSTAREAKEDLLAGDLELLSGHLEKAKRCHKHVTSAAVPSSAPAQQQPKQARQQPPNGASLSQPAIAAAPRPAASQASADSQR